MGEPERFYETGGYNHCLLDNNQVFEKTMETYGGNYAQGHREYSTGQHSVRLQLEATSTNTQANMVFIGIISSNVIATDQYFNRTSSTYAWGTSKYEDQSTIIQNGDHQQVFKDKWSGAKTGDILELTIDCDKQLITMENQTEHKKDSMKVDLNKCPLPWKFIVIFFTRPERVRLL